MTARNLARLSRVCVGDVIIITVKVQRGEVPAGRFSQQQDVPGVVVTGSVDDPSIGSLSQVDNPTGWDPRYPGSADYRFTAKKVGTTKLSFKGTIDRVWWLGFLFTDKPVVDRRDFVSDQTSVTVEECSLTVSALSKWQVQGEAALKFTALVDYTEVTADSNGVWTGAGEVTWTGAASAVGDCSGTVSPAPSSVDISGVTDAQGLVVMTMTFAPTTASIASNCGSYSFPLTADPVKFITGTDGGVSTQNHVLAGPESVTGRVTVEIAPTEPDGGS